MIIYQTRKSGFLHDVHHRDIEEVIREAFRAKTGHRMSKEEVRSWACSLTYMSKVLMDDAIPGDCGVAIKYTLPQTTTLSSRHGCDSSVAWCALATGRGLLKTKKRNRR